LIADIHEKNRNQEDQEYQVALGLRKQILESFFEMDRAAKAIKGFSATGNVRKLYDNVFTSVLLYLQSHMFTLEALPLPQTTDVPIQLETIESMAIRESIHELEFALEDCISKRRFEDAEHIRKHIEQLQVELSRLQGP
jgi:transcriptional regulator of aromatic amino acid metabolism